MSGTITNPLLTTDWEVAVGTGFDSGSGGALAALPKNGAQSVYFDGQGSSIYRQISDTGLMGTGHNVLAFRVYFRIKQDALTAASNLIQASSGGNYAAIQLRTSRKLRAVISGTNGTDSSTSLALDTWYLLDGLLDFSTGTASVSYSVDTVSQTGLTLSQTAANFSNFRIGWQSASFGQIYYDSLVVTPTSTDYPIGQAGLSSGSFSADAVLKKAIAGSFTANAVMTAPATSFIAGFDNFQTNTLVAVNGVEAVFTHSAANQNLGGILPVTGLAIDQYMRVKTNKLPVSSAIALQSIFRYIDGSNYLRAEIKMESSLALVVQITKRIAGVETLVGTPYTIPGLLGQIDTYYWIRVKATGVNPTTVTAKGWQYGTTEPSAWQVTGTVGVAGGGSPDDVVQTGGGVGFLTTLGTGITNTPYLLSADALLTTDPTPVTYEFDFTADAVIRETTAGSFTADAVFTPGSLNLSSFTADAHLKRVVAGSFTANAYLTRDASTAFSAIPSPTTGSATIDIDRDPAGISSSRLYRQNPVTGVWAFIHADYVNFTWEDVSAPLNIVVHYRLDDVGPTGLATASTLFDCAAITTDSWVACSEAVGTVLVDVTTAGYDKPKQTEDFAVLGQRYKEVQAGLLNGTAGSVDLIAASTVQQALVRNLTALANDPAKTWLKSPFGDVFEVVFSGPEVTYLPVGHVSAKVNFSSVADA